VGGTTDAINSIALSLVRSNLLPENPKIQLTELEHHSNILPWQLLKSGTLNYNSINEEMLFETETEAAQTKNPDLIAVTYVSNVTGTIADVDEIRSANKQAFIVLDAAQAIGHMSIDVKKLDIDFMVFSGHKMYGPTGIGVIYAKKKILENLEPFRVGGGMIREVTKSDATWAELPEKFEAGTPPIAEAVGLHTAASFIQEVGFSIIKQHEQSLRKYLVEKLQIIPEIKIYHPPLNKLAGAVISLSVPGAHPHDLAQYLGESNICTRAGHHCTQILHRDVLQIPASLRVSMGIYNTEEDIDKFILALQAAIKIYKR